MCVDDGVEWFVVDFDQLECVVRCVFVDGDYGCYFLVLEANLVVG